MKCYFITFKDSTTVKQVEDYLNWIQENGGSIKYDYRSSMKMLAACVPDNLVQFLTKDRIIMDLEPDGVARTQQRSLQ
ncbi:unnamed protein product [Rhizoctonia solani]|uniref:Inhibitor I9 domain-containing protein n=1 Tax=Rhizoctonia solani TaxID=456999 RepID=A0A8H2WWH6_9AGAM|nr:unnamed protein product [Rhizoctonia solani]